MRNIGDLGPPQFPELACLQFEKVLPVQADLPRCDIEAPPSVPQECKGNGRFARARLADETEQFRGPHGKGHVAHDLRPISGELDT